VIREGTTVYQPEKSMPFISIAERMTLVKGLLRGIEPLMRMRFGAEGLELMPEIREIRDPKLLEKVIDRIETASSSEEARRVWTRNRRSKRPESARGTSTKSARTKCEGPKGGG
jgi:hypothetical protein